MSCVPTMLKSDKLVFERDNAAMVMSGRVGVIVICNHDYLLSITFSVIISNL